MSNTEKNENNTCGKTMEIYSRIVGYFRPISNWNGGKKEEFKDRLEYNVSTSLKNFATKESLSPVTIINKKEVSVTDKVAVAA